MQRFALKSGLAILLSLSLLGCAQPPAPAPLANKNTQPDMLFVQAADKATLMPVTDQPGVFILTLYKVNRSILWFSDRPVHAAGSYTINEFMADWTSPTPNSFSINHPSAALFSFQQIAKTATRADSPIFILSYPIYDSKHREISYQAELAPGSPVPTVMSYDDVGLFVESSAKQDAPNNLPSAG